MYLYFVQTVSVLSNWRGHLDSITCLEAINYNETLISSSQDCCVRLWKWDGTFIGTFGQPIPWNLQVPSTFQHPMGPFDVLIDPKSQPPGLEAAINRCKQLKESPLPTMPPNTAFSNNISSFGDTNSNAPATSTNGNRLLSTVEDDLWVGLSLIHVTIFTILKAKAGEINETKEVLISVTLIGL